MRKPRLALIRLLILDVDGVLTDGALPYEGRENRVKTFFVQDGMALRLWQNMGGLTVIISGRQSEAVEIRAGELGIETVRQGVTDKLACYDEVCRGAGVSDEAVCVVGDDLPDLPPMRRCGYPIAVANANRQVKRAARTVTRHAGGAGAVAEAVERLLRHNGTWQKAMRL